MTPYYADESVALHHGDCLEVVAALPDNSVEAIVTDPPYGLGFMGKAWDDLPPGLPWAQQCLRVLKPGGHLLAFGGTRTWHRLAVAVEDAGFEVRDSIAWLYGSGFPKSLDVSKAIDKAAGATREVVGLADRKASLGSTGVLGASYFGEMPAITAPTTPAAQQWAGWGTALKPAFEPIVVARKPLVGTVAANVLAHGTGALNIDGTRVSASEALVRPSIRRDDNDVLGKGLGAGTQTEPAGRWPTNVVLDGDAAAELDEQSGTLKSGGGQKSANRNTPFGEGGWSGDPREFVGDSGGASRFFPVFGRDFACCDNEEHGPLSPPPTALPTFRYQAKAPTRERPSYVDANGVKQAHNTVKPLELMRWLVRLVTPPGGLVLEPFAGSGTTVEAAVLEGFRCVAIEREADYLPLILARLERSRPEPGPTTDDLTLFGEAS